MIPTRGSRQCRNFAVYWRVTARTVAYYFQSLMEMHLVYVRVCTLHFG